MSSEIKEIAGYKIKDEKARKELLNMSINVKNYGVIGDGLVDDTQAIQTLIDNNPHKTLFFPEGDYLISSPLNIKTGNEYQVNLKLDYNARIFTNTEIEELLAIGKIREGTWGRNSIGNIVTIEGGLWDCTNTTYGIYLTADRKQTRLLNNNIIKVANYGIYIDGATQLSSSSDALISNCSITGNGKYEENSCGIKLIGNDNELDEIRITSTKIGIHISGGGNLFSNVHMTAWFENFTSEMFNNSKGVILDGGNNYFNNFYVDTYGICFELNLEGQRNFINNLEVFYYHKDSNSIYTVFKYNVRNYIYLSNSLLEMPTNSENRLADIRNCPNDIKQYATIKKIIVMENVTALNITYESDLVNCLQLQNKNNVNINYNPWTVQMQQNKYYKILRLYSGFHKMNIGMAYDEVIEASIYASGSPKIEVKNLHSSGYHVNEYTLALIEGGTDENGQKYYYLAVSSNRTDSTLNASVSNISNIWFAQTNTVKDISTPLENPTVLASKSFSQ